MEKQFFPGRFLSRRPILQRRDYLSGIDPVGVAGLFQGMILVLKKTDTKIMQYPRKDVVLVDQVRNGFFTTIFEGMHGCKIKIN
jgi:hypothetical protein